MARHKETAGSEVSQDNNFRHGQTSAQQTLPPAQSDVRRRRDLFLSLIIKQPSLDSEFKAVNALVINHRMLWRLEMSPRFLCETGGSSSFSPVEY